MGRWMERRGRTGALATGKDRGRQGDRDRE
jgi:hypothetical protein